MRNYSQTTVKRKRRGGGSTDPRYKNGVHKSTQFDIKKYRQERLAGLYKPENYGWELVGEDDAGREVFMQFGLELRYYCERDDLGQVTENGWFVAKAGSLKGIAFEYCTIPALNRAIEASDLVKPPRIVWQQVNSYRRGPNEVEIITTTIDDNGKMAWTSRIETERPFSYGNGGRY